MIRKLASIGILAGLAIGCREGTPPVASSEPAEEAVTLIRAFDVSDFNRALAPGAPTFDVAFYLTDRGPVRWPALRPSIERAQRIFGLAGIQLRVRAALLLSVPPGWQAIRASEAAMPTGSDPAPSDLYARFEQTRDRLPERTRRIVEALIAQLRRDEGDVPIANTLHVLALRSVAYESWDDSGGTWVKKTLPAPALSFPPYAYAERIPPDLRGMITLSRLADTRGLAHEIGHKLINVSHEGSGVCPGFERSGEDLMLYGTAERIPAGEDGRWHRERLHLSPFLYRLQDGARVFNPPYLDGGIYADRVYGDLVMKPVCPGGE